MSAERQLRRCAIYTRKSSDEGLEQSFNSLHAQREACSAYVRSQQGEGWRTIAAKYDDGGYSGASVDRPALRRLLSDISMGRIDVVVVYKVDRLSRSLADFARIVEAFDKAKVSFVSVTQAFNTTSSMGRLTLNVLLSFAQFEREITGERIRDKIAASKAKGMWMGGTCPLGYDLPTDQSRRALIVNEDEAKTVRFIFQAFLSAGAISALQQVLDAQGIRSKRRATAAGRSLGGCRFSRGALRHLLSNCTYLGQVAHKGVAYEGRHPAIVDAATFEAAQKVLAAGQQKRRDHVPRRAAALLHRLLFDAEGQRMELITVAGRRRTTYRYYVSPGSAAASADAIRRVPADVLERLVLGRVASLLKTPEAELDRTDFRAFVSRVEVHPSTVEILLRRRGLSEGSAIVLESLRRDLLAGDQLTQEPADARLVRLALPIRMKLWGGRSWSVDANGLPQALPPRPDRALIKRLQEAHAIVRRCDAEPDAPLHRIRQARSPARSNDTAKAQWAFLAPDLQQRIFAGERPSVQTWPKRGQLPLLWSEQRALFGESESSVRAGETIQ